VSVAPSAGLSVTAGQSGTATVSVTRGGGFSGTVALAAQGVPAGVTLAFAPASLESGVTASTVTIQVATTVSPSTIPITVTASGASVTVATTTLTVTVVAPPTPTLALTLAPTSASVAAGASGTASASILRGGGFVGDVTLAATNMPTGVTVAFTPATLTAGVTTASLAMTVAATTVPGTYPLTVTATGAGPTPSSSVFTLTVTPAPSSRAVSLTYCTADAPIWVAFQDGGVGPWTRVLPNAGTSTYAFTVQSGKAGVASVDTVGSGYELNVSYVTAEEMERLVIAAQNGGCGAKTVTGSVANVPSPRDAFVSLGYAQAVVANPSVNSAFALSNVADGPQDLVAVRSASGSRLPDKIILRRAVNAAAGSALPVLDFNSAEAFDPATANVTITNLGSDTAFVLTDFSGVRGSGNGRITDIEDYVTASGAKPYAAMPIARLNAGELQQIYAGSQAANTPSSQRVTRYFFRNTSDRSVALGPYLTAPTVTRLNDAAYSRARIALPVQADYSRLITSELRQAGSNRSVVLIVTTAFTGGAAWDATLPILSGTSGWLDSWGLVNGVPITWFVQAVGGVVVEFDANVTEGEQQRAAFRNSVSPLP
jgi:hypothetical protein